MAATNEQRLLSRLIRDRDLGPALELGVASDWFTDPDERAVWDYLIRHNNRYGEVPTAVTVKDNFPTFAVLRVEDTIAYLLDQMRDYRRRQATISLVERAADALEHGRNHDEALRLLAKGLNSIDSQVPLAASHAVDIASATKELLAEYESLAARDDRWLLGLATGFPTIDAATAGLQDGQLVTIIAPPKTGKSVLLMQIAINIHARLGCSPLFQSFEMSNREQMWRAYAFRANISHARLTRGALTPADLRAFTSMLEKIEDEPSFLLTDSAVGNTVTALAAQIDKYDPRVVFVDGVYLMTDEESGENNTPKALTNITRSLKRLAQVKSKPIVVSTQALTWKMKGNEVTADSIGYSSSFFQDSDVILGLQRNEGDNEDTRILKIVGSRNCGPALVDLQWDWEHGVFAEYALT